jgi:light-regulated signal transduction histidine kinase (bacteriophytochrome)
MIAGEHMATLFIGQFFYEDEKPDVEFFRKQAEELGFNPGKYLEALRQVPVFSREKVQNIIDYYSGFVQLLSTMGYSNLHLARDIEKLKRAEEEIQKFNAELEHRVKQHTAELEVTNKELRNFTYIASHDLKAPLRGISQLAHWLVHDYADAFDEQGQEMVRLLINRVKRMDGLIDGILEYSRIGRIVGNDKEINLNDLVREVIDSLAPPDNVQILIESELPVIVGDRTRIVEVFRNLAENAIKFMDKPEGKITINCADEGSCWEFSITDNGPGIDPKYHEKIFRIFRTLAPRDVRESTGVGLALAKKIVEFYSGKIWVKSRPGRGSIFSFTLPKKGGKHDEQ